MKTILIIMFILNSLLSASQQKNVDFSKEWNEKEKINTRIEKDITEVISQLDFSTIWETNNDFPRNGAIGDNFQRIQVYITSVIKDVNNPLRYLCKGKTMVRNNVCDFTGEIIIENIYKYHKVRSLDDTLKNAIGGSIVANYKFQEDKTQNHVGTFNGSVISYWYLDTLRNSLHYDELRTYSDSYANNTFVGTWKGYSSTNKKLCIWGDYRLPYTAGLYVGAGDIIIGKEYHENGWQNFSTMWQEREQSKKKTYKWWNTKTP